MSRLTPLRSREVIRRLRALGYRGPMSRGRHRQMYNPRTGQRIPIPMHGSRDISVGLIRDIIRRAGISREEWNSL
ncbi:MAG: type II toxin-antitoxin system HicA family toxin [Dehalococcoidia bacterium]|nr:type II toxin-antitoxin system HicA family toxin [Dehalococcoidia bacterium]